MNEVRRSIVGFACSVGALTVAATAGLLKAGSAWAAWNKTAASTTSRIPNTQQISIVAEKNPFPLAATFDIANGAEAYVSTRLKMGQTSDVWAVVKAGGKFFTAKKEVKITVGGCG